MEVGEVKGGGGSHTFVKLEMEYFMIVVSHVLPIIVF